MKEPTFELTKGSIVPKVKTPNIGPPTIPKIPSACSFTPDGT